MPRPTPEPRLTPPKYVGMPPAPVVYKTRYGLISCGGPCKDDYDRIDVYVQTAQRYVKLQRAALRSFHDAEDKLGYIIPCTGTWRACSTQWELYRQDPSRYAAPNTTAHCRGLAIDVVNTLSPKKKADIRRALANRGWHQARPDDEPWHYSFGIKV